MKTREERFQEYLEEIRNCVCCQNNFDDPDGHTHGPHCYGTEFEQPSDKEMEIQAQLSGERRPW